MKKFVFLPLWFVSSIVFAGGCIVGIQKLRAPQSLNMAVEVAEIQPETVIQENLPPVDGEVKGLSTVVEIADARPEIIENFLSRYKSPLTPHDEYGKKLVEIADKYNLDYRLLPAIAMQESNLCKKIPVNSHNCLGYGITSKGTLRFESYEAAFEAAAKGLAKNYIAKGLDTPEKIVTKYTPGSKTWAPSINRWIAEMESDDKTKGKEASGDADLLEYTSMEADADIPVPIN